MDTSVIIPVRNGELFIAAALYSVLAELRSCDEIIIVDDGSTDATLRIARNVAPSALHLTTGGLGVSAARNEGLRAARGELISFLDCDDLWPPGRQAVLRGFLQSNSSLDAVAGRVRLKIDEGTTAGDLSVIDGTHSPSILMTCLYRRSLLDRVGFFDERLSYGEDLDYHWRLVEAGMRLALSESDALIYRRHAGNITNSAPPRQKTIMKLLALRAARNRERAAATPSKANAAQ